MTSASKHPSRRDFLRRLGVGTATAVGAGYGLSVWGGLSEGKLGDTPAAASTRVGQVNADTNGHTLVIVELGGGNDGLNTVVPLQDGRYRDLRPTLGVTDAIDLDGEVGLHPSLPKLASRYGNGHVAVIEGLGYDDADLSHFGSFAIWWSAKGGTGGGGWLGAYLDGTVGFDDPLAAISIGPGPSPALIGRASFATTIADASGLQPRVPAWLDSTGQDVDDLIAAWSDVKPAHVDTTTLVGQVQRAVGLTVKARTKLDHSLEPESSAARSPTSRAERGPGRPGYQDTSVGDSLLLAAELVQSPARPRIVYINGVGDFDTHQGQAERHPVLLEQLDEGIDGFFSALDKSADQQVADRVVLMTVSEFGRRPQENGSGTDHGTANVHFVVGPKVKGGRYGEPASLTHLDEDGNLRHTDDFRRHYASGLRWLGVEDTTPVLGDDYKAFPMFE
ncbi:MAG: DUF1501 domain-containing protein [Acidimicrobiia bacterium]